MSQDIMEQEKIGSVTIVRLSGRLDAKAANDIKEKMYALEFGKDGKVLLNLSGVSFIDSSGLGLVVSTFRRLREQGGDLVLCGLTPPVRTIFELTRLHRVFDIYEDEQQALAAL